MKTSKLICLLNQLTSFYLIGFFTERCFRADLIKDTLKAFDNFKNKQPKCMKQCFLICKSIYILKVYLIHYTLR